MHSRARLPWLHCKNKVIKAIWLHRLFAYRITSHQANHF
jgi:hypothetical protein